MTRTRQSAKAAGTRFEKNIANYLAEKVDDRIERRVLGGSKDRGDLSGIRHRGHRITAECKNTTRTNLAGWIKEAHLEAGNDDAAAGIVIFKRHGVADPARQWCLMTVEDLAFFLTGEPQEGRYEP